MASELKVSMLGSPRVTLGGEPVAGFVSVKAQVLVYYLAATELPHRRDALAGLLWSDVAESRAKKNLRDVLSNLRRLVGPFLTVTRQEVALNLTAELTVDTGAFMAAVQAGDIASLAQAAVLYQGDFLEGVFVSEAPAFEEWVLGKREQYRQLALQALTTLGNHYISQGNYMRAVEVLSQLLSIDLWREEAHRQLMILLTISGQSSAALTQYDRLCAILAEDLGAEPHEKTVQLAEQIRAGKLAVSPDITPAESLLLAAADKPAGPAPAVHNLPPRWEAFVGRQMELNRVQAWLSEAAACRLLTVVGPGGVGKTALALEAARSLARQGVARDGIYFVPLASLAPAREGLLVEELVSRIVDSLPLTLSGSEPAVTQLLSYVRHKEMLLVLDNFEQLVRASPVLLDLLEATPHLKIMLTSRRPLNVSGEHLLLLDGLPYPETTMDRSPDMAETDGAMQLFLERSRQVAPGFQVGAANWQAVAQICQLVGGLPLGIELAARWMRYLSPQEIASELAGGLRLLESGQDRHQQSLRAVFEHSWNLLGPAEQQALGALSIFQAGFGRQAAKDVAGVALPQLATLVDNSLLRLVRPPEGQGVEETRYELLTVLRPYVVEKVGEAQMVALRDQHSAYFLQWTQCHDRDLRTKAQQRALRQMAAEIDNLRAAWDWAVERRNAAALGQAMESLFRFYYMRSLFQEGAERFGQAAAMLATLSESVEIQRIWGQMLARQGWFVFQLGRQQEGQDLLRQSLEMLLPLGDPASVVLPLNYLAAATYYLGDYGQARELCQQGLAASRACRSRHDTSVAKSILAQIAYAQGDYSQAKHLGQESLAIDRQQGNPWGMAFQLFQLARCALAVGDYVEAHSRLQEALTIRQALGDARGTGHCLTLLGEAAEGQGEYEQAQGHYRAALAIFEDIGNHWGASAAETRMGRLAHARGVREQAEAHLLSALDHARLSDAVPLQLGVLAELALLRAGEDPLGATAWARLVWQHPAATQESKDRIEALLVDPAQSAASVTSGSLEAVVGSLLD